MGGICVYFQKKGITGELVVSLNGSSVTQANLMFQTNGAKNYMLAEQNAKNMGSVKRKNCVKSKGG